ncbi:30S ribosomal protein S21 [Patescibacteria group bacterium]|nr:30S ribosomal protein S21 [Patescibacteria group bacterium]
MNVGVKKRDGETSERALRRFINLVKKSGLWGEIRKLHYYENPSTIRNNINIKKKRELSQARLERNRKQ